MDMNKYRVEERKTSQENTQMVKKPYVTKHMLNRCGETPYKQTDTVLKAYTQLCH